MLWLTVSKAFFRSMKTPQENKRLSIFVWTVLTMSIIACCIECAFRKPYCDEFSIPFSSIKDCILAYIIFSKIRLKLLIGNGLDWVVCLLSEKDTTTVCLWELVVHFPLNLKAFLYELLIVWAQTFVDKDLTFRISSQVEIFWLLWFYSWGAS